MLVQGFRLRTEVLVMDDCLEVVSDERTVVEVEVFSSTSFMKGG
jgi:hypothetical protein